MVFLVIIKKKTSSRTTIWISIMCSQTLKINSNLMAEGPAPQTVRPYWRGVSLYIDIIDGFNVSAI